MPLCPLLSLMFDPQDFFLPKEILLRRKQAHFLSLSSTNLSAQPQASKIAENYHGTPNMSYTCHEERIEDILNHLDELSLDHIKEMKGHVDGLVIIQQDFDKLKTELQEARAQIAGLPRKQMRHNDKIALARFWISTLELIIKDIQCDDSYLYLGLLWNPKPRETPAARKCTYEEFMSFQPFYFNGTKGAVGLIRWFERTESVFSYSNCTDDCKVKFATVKKMKDEFYNLVMKGKDLKTYARRFQELAVLFPNMVPNNEKLMEVFIGGLPRSIEGNVTASKPQTSKKAINITQRLMDQVTKHNSVQGTNEHKRKFDDSRNTDNNNYPNDRNNNNHSNNRNHNNYQDKCNNYNRNNDYHQQQNRRQGTVRTYAAN
nr:reverse transcriptase domain-containing protein [Tanacetum cinerariifolium]